MLFYFKYFNFFAAEIGPSLSSLLGRDLNHWTKVIMPIGVSFVVFEEISYLVDVYRGHSRPAKTFFNYALFLFLFPHSIAGPIFRWKDLESQISSRQHTIDKAYQGAIRFFFGLGKKVLIADSVAMIADVAFQQNPAFLPMSYAWLGIVAYTLQIYFDFSGYSDMAIGLGNILGFQFKENFNAPYIATSITDFWRRWHISLSNWMRDYLYIPLGGNRLGAKRTYFNLFVVFLASGFWHGANWTFLTWGGYHGVLLIGDRLFWEEKVVRRLPKSINVTITVILIMIGWVLFRANSLDQGFGYIQRLFDFRKELFIASCSWGELASNRSLLLMAVGILICLSNYYAPLQQWSSVFMGRVESAQKSFAQAALQCLCACGILFLTTLNLVAIKFSPFIYFRF
jgi:alginate O-acetyltransferase complex protein AlgI